LPLTTKTILVSEKSLLNNESMGRTAVFTEQVLSAKLNSAEPTATNQHFKLPDHIIKRQ
jgi:hypothetical protein